MNVEIGELSAEIEKALDGMNKEVIEQMNEAIKETASDTVKELKSSSPEGRSGRYAKGWTVKVRDTNIGGISSLSVCNRTDYQLTHLLENGHVIKATGDRTRAFAHIKPAEEHAQEEFTEKVGDIRL